MSGLSWIALDADRGDDRSLEVAWDRDQHTALVRVSVGSDTRATTISLSDLLTILTHLWRAVKATGTEPGALVVPEPNTDGSGRGPWVIEQ